MTIEIAVVISLLSLLFSICFGVANLKRNDKNDAKMDQSQLTTVIVKLENIGNDITEMKGDLRDVKEDLKNHSERLVKVEQQIKVLNNNQCKISFGCRLYRNCNIHNLQTVSCKNQHFCIEYQSRCRNEL